MDTLVCAAMLAAAAAFVGVWAAGQVRAVRRHRAGGAR